MARAFFGPAIITRMASLHSLLAALLLVGAAGAPPFRYPAELAAPADLPTNLLQFAETAVGESDRSVGRESLDLQLAPDATDELLPYLGLRLDASGLSTHIEYADCHARMSIAPGELPASSTPPCSDACESR